MAAHRNKASRVVTAALVGALSVGVMPMMALATEASSGATTLASSTRNYIDATVSYEGGTPGDTFTYTGEGQGLVPTTITTDAGETFDLTPLKQNFSNAKGYYYYYVQLYERVDVDVNEDGTVDYADVVYKYGDINDHLPSEIGTYVIIVYFWDYNGPSGYGTYYVESCATFSIEAEKTYPVEDGVYLNFRGRDVNGAASVAYSGTDWLEKASVEVVSGGAELVEGATTP